MGSHGLMSYIRDKKMCKKLEEEVNVVIDGDNFLHHVYNYLIGSNPDNSGKIFQKSKITICLDDFFGYLEVHKITVTKMIFDGVGDYEKRFTIAKRKNNKFMINKKYWESELEESEHPTICLWFEHLVITYLRNKNYNVCFSGVDCDK